MLKTFFTGKPLFAAFLAASCLGCFAAVVSAQDPPEFRIPDRLGQAGNLFGSPGDADLKPFTSLEVTGGDPKHLKPGDEIKLSITLLLPPKSYTYSTNPSFGGCTKIRLDKIVGLEPIDGEFQTNNPPKKVMEPLLSDKPLEKLFNDVIWSKRFRVKAGAESNPISVSGKISYQVCDDQRCKPLNETFHASLANVSSGNSTASNFKNHPLDLKITPTKRKNKPEPITFEFRLSPENAKPGEDVTLSITARPDKEWHIFALTQDPKMFGKPTVIELENVNGLKPIDDEFTPDKKPEIYEPEELENVVQQFHEEEVKWSKRFTTVLDPASTDGYGVEGRLRYQVCREGTCRLLITVPFALGTVKAEGIQLAENPPNLESPDSGPSGKQGETSESAGDKQIAAEGLIPFLVTAVLAGFAALLTPCVFPMIPITVSFFLKQSEKEHHKPVSMALIYCAGIIGAFTVIGLLMAVVFGAASLNKFANGPWMNLAIAGVLIFFGMNLLGMFEIRIPSWLLTWSSGHEGRGGIVGVLFMALTFTLVSFTCTFAFIGALLVWATKGEYFWPILGMLGFSTAFALPFFFLALFPSYLQKLPKSGGWMNTVKVTMGMIEVGAAFKFLSVADLAWFPEAFLFDYSMVLSAWMIISICTGLYLLGLFRLPHDTPTESISVVRLSFAMTFLGLAGYLAVGLFAPTRPTGKIWEQIAAFAPPSYKAGSSDIGPYVEHDGLQYALDFERAFQVAREKNQPVFIDFTGENCTNCRLMEHRMEKPELRKRLSRFVLVRVYADSVPTVPRQEEVSLLEKNVSLQIDWFGDVSLPSYAIVTPDREVLAKIVGQQSEDVFLKFLEEGLRKWEIRSGNASLEQIVHQR